MVIGPANFHDAGRRLGKCEHKMALHGLENGCRGNPADQQVRSIHPEDGNLEPHFDDKKLGDRGAGSGGYGIEGGRGQGTRAKSPKALEP